MLPDTHKHQTLENENARLQAFSDGVFSIAITLLVFNIAVPRDLPQGQRLLDALWHLWPSYFAFITSFLTIGVMWINHHNLFKVIVYTDHVLLALNVLLMLMVTFVNFPTAVLGAYITNATEQYTAGVFYCGTFAVTASVYNLLWRYAERRLLAESVDKEVKGAISRAYNRGLALYWLTFGVAFISTSAALLCSFALALFFALPARVGKGGGEGKP